LVLHGRIAVFGGTFDPLHIGHLCVAQDVYEALDLDRVVFVPAGAPPHRPDGAYSPGEVRLQMVRSAIEGDERFLACDLEVRRPGTSYTVDTLRQLQGESEPDALFLIVGADQFRAFEGWKDPMGILELADLVVVSRDGTDPIPGAPDVPHRHVPIVRVDVSSTSVRSRRRSGRSIRYLVPDGVRRIIERERLYQ
jgi:nicotinate-nucleotide adenylyltransferase